MPKKTKKSHQWTKDELRTLINLWESHSIEDIAGELSLQESQIKNQVITLRKSGFPLTKKRVVGYKQAMLRDLFTEMYGSVKIKKNTK